jgi:uncharacterized protein YdhG (YjbR/CyaY superfamily)
MAENFATVDEYICSRPEGVQSIIQDVRRTLRNAIPGAGEKISYQMPTITLDGSSLLYFAAWKHHIGLYPIPTADEALEQELAPYRSGRDTVRFPLRQPMPHDLIERLAALLVQRRKEGTIRPS